MAKAATTNATYMIVIILGLLLVAGSFILRLNNGSGTTDDERVIEYTYQNEGNDSQKRNRFRKIQLRFENIQDYMSLGTKKIRLSIHRSGEINDKQLFSGKVFSIILEDMAKAEAVVFDQSKCVVIDGSFTKITVFLLKKYEGHLAFKAMVVIIDRETDKLTMLGRELSTEDIWNRETAGSSEHHDMEVPLDKGFIRDLQRRSDEQG